MTKIFRDNLISILGLISLGVIGYAIVRTPQAAQLVEWGKVVIYWPVILPALSKTFLNPTFFIIIFVILVVERLFPVNPEQKTFSSGFFQDMGWLVFALFFEGIVLFAYVGLLENVYKNNFGFIQLGFITTLPIVIRFIWGALLGDFFSWFQHWIKHKVSIFWEFHALHHSQKELNLFSDFRFHFMEYLISRAISVIPMLILSVDTPTIVTYSIFTMWLTRFYHANIKTNFGLLRYIFVTPQSHRVHHSIEKRHQDKNFGVVFSVWDRIFKTQYTNYTEYPDTGIEDEEFPLEMETSLLSVLIIGYRQTMYPFLKIIKKFNIKN